MPNLTLPDETLGVWLDLLKPYQRATLKEFLNSMGPEAAAEKWLSTIGSPNIVGFGGGIHGSKPFWDKFKSEFRKLICDDASYVQVKESLRGERPIVSAMTILGISEALGSVLGVSGTLLAPAVAIMLFGVGQVTVNAFCCT